MRDFEYAYGNDTEFQLGILWIDKTGYKIPKEYEPYEIKKVSEIIKNLPEEVILDIKNIDSFSDMSKDFLNIYFEEEYNLKEDDKVVVRRK